MSTVTVSRRSARNSSQLQESGWSMAPRMVKAQRSASARPVQVGPVRAGTSAVPDWSAHKRPQVDALVREQVAVGVGLFGDEARAGSHLGIGFPFGIAAAVEADRGPHNPGEQVEADQLSVFPAPADREV